MQEKRKKLSLVLMMSFLTGTLLLAGCVNLSSSSSDSTSTTTKKSSYQVTGTNDNNHYQILMQNGRYKTSSLRGLTVNQNDNQFNVSSFENGLVNLSKNVFSTDKYVLQEGQNISESTAYNWLGRKSKSNPTGLNPIDNKQTAATKRNPIYLQELLEEDFLTKSGNSYALSGVSVGLGLNEVDYYRKVEYGAIYQTTISAAQREAQGKAMAQKVLSRLRQKKKLKNVPIMLALYTQAPDDSLVGGTFFTYAVSQSGTTLSSWTKVSQQNQVLPTVNNEKAVSSSDSDAFNNFKSQVQSYFPNLSGVTAQAHYVDSKLAGMKVSIVTQFYGSQEINALTQYVATAANHYLPSGVPIEIDISSVSEMLAFAQRNAADKTFTTHVFSSY